MRDESNSDLGKRFLDIRAADKELTYSVLKKRHFTLLHLSEVCALMILTYVHLYHYHNQSNKQFD